LEKDKGAYMRMLDNMKLPFLQKFAKKRNLSYYLVLVLRSEKVNAVIFEEEMGKVSVIGLQEEYFDNSIEEAPQDELLDVIDKAISQAESSLPPNIETQKTVFGIKEKWAENNKIKKEYLLKLKKISDELGLTPIGFLIIPEAISHLLQKEEGAPVSAILVEVGKKFTTVSLIRAGKIIESKSSQIHESVAYTVDSLLKHFETPEILPSRIILFDGKVDLSQEFIGHQWSKSLPFLHLPQIKNLSSGFDAKSVLVGAATQMGFEVLASQELQKDEYSEEEIEKEERKEENIHEEEPSPEYFGFINDKDIANVKLPKTTNIQEEIPKSLIKEQISEIPQEIEEKIEKKPLSFDASIILKGGLITFAKILSVAKKIHIKGLLSSLPTPAIGTKIIFAPIFGLIILALIAFFYLFNTHATVNLNINPKIINKTQDVIFSTSSPTNSQNNIIAGELVSVSEEDSSTTNATGKKEVGDKAKGTVTVFNLSNSITLPAGTIITSSNSLTFTLDDKVLVASGSSDPLSPQSGTAKTNITASDIGTGYNLPSNTKFSIGSNSSIAAKNDNPFSLGTKKEVTVVAKNDIDKLSTDIQKNLEQKAKDDLSKQISANKILLPVFVDTAITKKTPDKNIGDEAKQVTLRATVTYQGLSYDKKDGINLAKGLIASGIPNNLTIDESNIKIDAKDIKQTANKQIQASLNVQAPLLPNIDKDKIRKEISGKSFIDAQKIIFDLPQIANIQISVSPNIPFLPKMLPRNPKNIKIQINVNG